MRASTRPPAQYVPAQGTKFRLVANEYDKNTYGQCNYASYRTLIRCKQIRSKDELAKNGGHCEEHVNFSKILEQNHKREVMRTHAENDTKMQRRRFDPWIASNEYISDEDDYLQAVRTLPSETPDYAATDDIIDDHPLRFAGTFTDKDVLAIKMNLVQKDIDNLLEFKQLVVNQAQKEHDLMENDEEADGPTDLPQRRVFKAAGKYSRNDYCTLTTIDPVCNQCCVGPEMDDNNVINHVVHSLLDKLDEFPPISVENQCLRPALHMSKFCIDHITLDRRQKLFSLCRTCGVTALGSDDPTCTFHIKSHTGGATSCTCHRCIQSVSKLPLPTDSIRNSLEFDLSEDEEDQSLANLSNIGAMASPLQQFSIPPLASPSSSSSAFPSTSRRYSGTPAQILRSQISGSSKSMTAQKVGSNISGYQQSVRQKMEEQMKLQEEELKSQTCARVRPIESSQYGAEKDKANEKLKQQHPTKQFLPGTSGLSSYAKKPISNFPSSGNVPGKRSSGQFGGWKNTPGTTGGTLRAMHQQMHMGASTRYPVQQQRPPPPPKIIPLDRAQEPKTGDELVEDRGSPTRFQSEPQRRGVPYYKNSSVYRRVEIPTHHAQHSPSSGPLLPPGPPAHLLSSQPHGHPPPQPPSHRFRPPGQRPMAPHRAIAAGLNPADVVNASTPRPSYRMIPNQQPQHPQYYPPAPATPLYHQSPVPRRPNVPPQRMLAGGGSSLTPPKMSSINYNIVESSPSGASYGEGSSQQLPPLLPTVSDVSPSASRFANPALDTALHDVRFANMNVKTFLSMSSKDLDNMTQEEIDLLASNSQQIKKFPPARIPTPSVSEVIQSTANSIPMTTISEYPTTSPSSSRYTKKRKIDQTIDEVVQIATRMELFPPIDDRRGPITDFSTYSAPTPTSTPISSPPHVSETTSSRTLAPEDSTSSGEPLAKKPAPNVSASSKRITTSEKEKETNDTRTERAKTPKTPGKKPALSSSSSAASTSSGRTPRAAAIAANNAIAHNKPPTSSSSGAVEESCGNPLNILAELSEAAAAEEQQILEIPAKSGSVKKASKKPSPKQRRQSSSSKKRGDSEDYEEEF
uniref:Zf-C3Hc3H domain-containing protein n=1 Tax=Caenorhabditis japonica TaxID=281687 RepID=A0A8R1HKP7_CAEJA